MEKKTKTTKAKVPAKRKPRAVKKEKPEEPKVLEAVLPAESSEEGTEVLKEIKSNRYIAAVGRRKTSIARVWIYTQGDRKITVNGKPFEEYFNNLELQRIATASLEKMKCQDHFRVSAKIQGGGIHSQAEALRHGLSRALVEFNPDFRKRLRRAGFLTRDSRARERKKFGLKRARRAPQWAKR